MADTPDMITLRRPDDWHLHLRDGAQLAAVAPLAARRFARAMVMPNLDPPVTTKEAAEAYRRRILDALPAGSQFEPLMTCYLTDQTVADELAQGFDEGAFAAAKLYPAGATTNSAAGVTDMARLRGALARMEEIGMPLLVHGEVVDAAVDVFDREAVFIERVLAPLVAEFVGLEVVFEHITTTDAVDFVRAHAPTMGATITAHHLMINRSALFAGGIRPHLYCLPVAKRERHRLALVGAATSGEACFFLGTDSAPHGIGAKENECGCAGIFTGASALELYAEVFAEEGKLDNLGAFASVNGATFYGLPVNETTVTLVRRDWTVAERIEVAGADAIRPFLAGETIPWKLAGE